jgi:hypothetical protein
MLALMAYIQNQRSFCSHILCRYGRLQQTEKEKLVVSFTHADGLSKPMFFSFYENLMKLPPPQII